MKIIITADLHAEFLQQGALDKFARKLIEQKPDVLIAAGDIGVGKHWARALMALNDVAPVRYVVGGNHDYYVSDYDFANRGLHRGPLMKFEKQLSAEAEQCGWEWAEESIIRVGNDRRTAIVCSCAWYDYELSGPNIEAAKEAKQQYHSDARYIDAYDECWDDQAFCAQRKASIVRRLNECEADSGIDNVILVTHVPIFREQRVPMPGDLPELDGCFYAPSIGREVLRFRKLSNVISAHTHRGMDGLVERPDMDPIHVQIIGADYNKPAFVTVTA